MTSLVQRMETSTHRDSYSYGTYKGKAQFIQVKGRKRVYKCNGCNRYQCNCHLTRCIVCKKLEGVCTCRVCVRCNDLAPSSFFKVIRVDIYGDPDAYAKVCNMCKQAQTSEEAVDSFYETLIPY